MQKRPIYPIHPGEIVADELKELNKSPTELARGSCMYRLTALHSLLRGKEQ